MKKRGVLLGVFFLFSFLLIGNVFALGDCETESGIRFTGKQSTSFNVYDVCNNAGLPCDGSYTCNFTIIKPDQTILVNNVATSKTGNIYNYVLNTSQTSSIGVYEVYSTCTNGTNGGCLKFKYDITSSGETYNQSQGLMIIGEIGLIILFAALGFSFNQKKWKLKAFFFMIALFFATMTMNSLRIMAGASTTLSTMADVGLIIGIIILSFMFLYILIIYLIELFHYFKAKNRKKWGLSDQF